MKRCSSQPALSRDARGFTLVELLVSITVLALLMVLTAQLITNAGQTITNSGKRTDSDSQSRLVFNRIGQDLARLVKRKDVDFSTLKQPANPAVGQPANLQDATDPGSPDHNDRLAFYSESTGGYTASNGAAASSFSTVSARAPTSLLAYQVAVEPAGGAISLRRLTKALGWEPGGTWANPLYLPLKLTDLRINGNPIRMFSDKPLDPGSTVDADYSTIGDMVFRFEYSYLLKGNLTNPVTATAHQSIVPYEKQSTPPHTAANGLQDVAAIIVTLGVLDSTSRVITSQAPDQLAKLIAIFPDAVEGQDTLKAWQAVLNKPTFAGDAGLPRAAASGVRLYQRTFYLEPKN